MSLAKSLLVIGGIAAIPLGAAYFVVAPRTTISNKHGLPLETIASLRIADRFKSFESRAEDRRGLAPRRTLEQIQQEQQSQYPKPSRQLRHVGSLVAGMVREENAADVAGGH